MSEKKHYLLGTEQKQEWIQEYYFAPKGIGFLEPGIVGNDSAKFAGFNVAKSFYQTHPEVFNIAYVAEKTGLDPEDIKKRLKRMYDERIMMLVKNSAVSLYGFGLYYWVVKLKDGTPKGEKQKFIDWFQNKNDICTGYQTEGDFDFYNGNHMRVLDNLLTSIIDPWKNSKWVEYVHLCPIRRDLRESSVNMFDIKGDAYREYVWSEESKKKLLAFTDKIDGADFDIIDVLNNVESIGDMFDWKVLEDLSGLDGETMKTDLCHIVDDGRFVIPMIFLNWMKLGLTNHCFLVKTFQNVPSYRKEQIADELAETEEFNNLFEFSDAYHDFIAMSYNEVCDIDKLRKLLEAYPEIEEIKEADSPRQFRRWTARLDDEDDNWEECIFTDDFLQNRMEAGTPVCPFCKDDKGVK